VKQLSNCFCNLKTAKMKAMMMVLFGALANGSYGQNTEVRIANYNIDSKNVSIDGYDPVSYFKDKPQKGDENNSYMYKGVTYWFSSESNRKEFEKNPLKYEPQYGGWCAYALGLKPKKVKIDPKTYKIIDNKLYLFYNFNFTNTLHLWDKEEESLKDEADKNWSLIIN